MKVRAKIGGGRVHKREFDSLSFAQIAESRYAIILNGVVCAHIDVEVAEDGDTREDTGSRYVGFTVNDCVCDSVNGSFAASYIDVDDMDL